MWHYLSLYKDLHKYIGGHIPLMGEHPCWTSSRGVSPGAHFSGYPRVAKVCTDKWDFGKSVDFATDGTPDRPLLGPDLRGPEHLVDGMSTCRHTIHLTSLYIRV